MEKKLKKEKAITKRVTSTTTLPNHSIYGSNSAHSSRNERDIGKDVDTAFSKIAGRTRGKHDDGCDDVNALSETSSRGDVAPETAATPAVPRSDDFRGRERKRSSI